MADKIEATAQNVREVLIGACPGLRVEQVRPGPSGYSSSLWLAETDEGPLLVRVPKRSADPERARSMMLATRMASEAGVPTVRFRAFAPRTPLGPVVIQEYRAGERATDVLAARGADLTTVVEALGRWVATIHGVQRAWFGDPLGAVTSPDWPTCATARVVAALRATQPEALPQASVAVEQAFARALALLPADTPASLVHADLYLDNILVTDGRAVCLLDFEHASFADRFAEFGKLNELLFERWPGSEAALMAGYQESFPADLGDAARVHVGIGLYELSQLAYFSRWQPDLAPVYRDRLALWLTRDGDGAA